MSGYHQEQLNEVDHLLQQLSESCRGGGLENAAPKTLPDLINKAKEIIIAAASSTARPPKQKVVPHYGGDDGGVDALSLEEDNNVARKLVVVLIDIARCVLTSKGGGGVVGGGSGLGTTAPKARVRALSLDCLRLGLLLTPRHAPDGGTDGQEGLEREALAVAAVGARDERWEVRVAAARTGGEASKIGGPRSQLRLLSSGRGCWLPAMLFDGYPEVEAAARAALNADPIGMGGNRKADNANSRQPTTPPSPPSCPHATPSTSAISAEFPASSAVAVAVIRGGCEVLRAAALAAGALTGDGDDDDGVADPTFVDLAEEETMRTALRALRAGGSLLNLQQQQQQQQQSEKKEEEDQSSALVGALELIEAWLAGTLSGPPDASSVPWAEGGEAHGAAVRLVVGSTPGGTLSFEARGAVRALLLGRAQAGMFHSAALEAAVAAVEECRSECLLGSDVGHGSGRGSRGEEEEETLWRRVYCDLLVRLEILFTRAAEEKPSQSSSSPTSVERSSREVKPGGKVRDTARSSSSSFSADPNDESTAGAAVAASSSFLSLAGVVAQALGEVPFAHDQAVPSNLDQLTDVSGRDKKALRARGALRRRWVVSCANLLLRAGARFCERCRLSSVGAGSESHQRGRGPEPSVVKMLVAALPFLQAATRADEPAEAWLSCVRPEAFPVKHANSTGTTSLSAGVATTAVAKELSAPIPWQSCVHGMALPRHELPAPWAAGAATTKLGMELVDTAWAAISLDDSHSHGGSSPERSAEALVLALRTAARARGGWRDEAAVGVKHAVSAAIRRLRFPLVNGATLGHSLPLVLPLADDYDPSHQAVGFSLVLHLGAEASPTELGWHRGLLLEVLERGIKGGAGRNPSTSALCLAAAVRLLRRTAGSDTTTTISSSSAGRAGIRIARETLAQAARATDGVVRKVMVCGGAALLELPCTSEGYAPCEILRPSLLCLLPILQSSPVSTRLDARAASLRAVHALCLSCWPRVHAHTSKLLCALLWTCGDCMRRASVRESSSSLDGGVGGGDHAGGGNGGAATAPSPPLGIVLAANYAAMDAKTDDAIRSHATRLGALVLLLSEGRGSGGGSSSSEKENISFPRAALRDICAAVTALRPAGRAMEELADRAAMSEGELEQRDCRS